MVEPSRSPSLGAAAGSACHPALTREILVRLAAGFSVEVTPRDGLKVASFRALLPQGTRVYITYLPRDGFDGVIPTAARLAQEGMVPVPHVAVRALAGLGELAACLTRLVDEAGVEEILLVAGSIPEPAGELHASAQVLGSGLLERCGIRRIGVAGHPEGNPEVGAADLGQALAEKNAHAERIGTPMHIVTQFCFDAGGLITWERSIRASGNRLPIHVGLHGIASLPTLLKYGMSCGVGASLRFLEKQAGNVFKLASTHSPGQLIVQLAQHLATTPESGFERLHFFPFGGFERTARWARAVADGAFTLGSDGHTLKVEV